MTDEPETPLTPAQEEEVRRLLADARHDEPMPATVADRLDRVLDDLAAEPVRRAPVTDLATRRRRVTSLLVAAAAVVVVGIGIGQVTGAGGGGDADSGSSDAGGTAADAPNASAEEAPQAGDDEAARDSEAGRDVLVEGRVFELQPDQLSRELGQIQSYVSQAPHQALSDGDVWLDSRGSASTVVVCDTSGLGPGTFVPVRYDGRRAVVVFRKPAGDTQVAEVYVCGDTEPVQSLTLPVP